LGERFAHSEGSDSEIFGCGGSTNGFVVWDEPGGSGDGLGRKAGSVGDSLRGVASAEEIDGIVIELRVSFDELGQRERIVELIGKGGRLREPFVDKVAQNEKVVSVESRIVRPRCVFLDPGHEGSVRRKRRHW